MKSPKTSSLVFINGIIEWHGCSRPCEHLASDRMLVFFSLVDNICEVEGLSLTNLLTIILDSHNVTHYRPLRLIMDQVVLSQFQNLGNIKTFNLITSSLWVFGMLKQAFNAHFGGLLCRSANYSSNEPLHDQ